MSDSEPNMSEKHQNKPTLYDMPMDVFDNVMSNLEYKTHMVLRKVSKTLRQIVDRCPPALKSVSLSIDNRGAELSFNGTKVAKKPVEVAIRDLKSAIWHPKIQLEHLKIEVELRSWKLGKDGEVALREKYADRIENVLTTLPHRRTLNVKKLELHVNIQDEILAVLAHLTPGVLETIHIEYSSLTPSMFSVQLAATRLAMTKIIKLEQWKRAKHLHMDRFTVQFPVDNIKHFETTHIHLASVSMQQLKVLRDAHLRNPNFVSLQLESSRQFDFYSLDAHLGAGIPQNEPNDHDRYYPVPGSEDHVIHIFVNWNFARMERILKSAIPENSV